jgi:hypothetical protein
MARLALANDAVIALFLPALLAAIGYLTKLLIGTLQDRRMELTRRRTRLLQLQALLRASRAAFDVQNDLAVRLAQVLKKKHPDLAFEGGYDDVFARIYPDFDSEDRDLHSIIRGYSKHALRPLNKAVLAWLEEDIEHRSTLGKSGDQRTLALMLNELDSHVRLWLAKYEVWLPAKPEHALVYLDDEKKHGLRFPPKLDDTLQTVLEPSK